MSAKTGMMTDSIDKPSQSRREVLVEQILWLIQIRWVAVGGIITAALIGNYAFPYPVLTTAVPIYICAGLLFLSNVVYFCVAAKKTSDASPKDVVLATVQVEADLVILTMVLHFSGGVVNPFFLFYIFHVIIATIILPRNLSFAVGLTTIFLFGVLAFNELNGGGLLGYYPLRLAITGGLWGNPVYVLGGFVAFTCTVVLSQYLTRIIIVQMTAKEFEAARNNDMLKAVISAMAEGLIFVNHTGNITICNPAAMQWKKDSDIDTGVHLPEDFPPVLSEHLKNLLADTTLTAEICQPVKFHTSGEKQRYIEAESCPVFGADGQKLGYVIVGQDLTEHRKLEKNMLEQTEQVTAINEMLKMTRVEMAERERMVTLGQMAAGIAHEIGNPLANLSSVAQYLGRKLITHEEKEHLLVIEHQVNRISNILKRMLSLSRPATTEYKWVDINELIDNTLSFVQFDKRLHSISIKSISNPDLPMVWLNPQLFEQVLLNIFINALDAMNAKAGEQEHILEITREFKDEMVKVRISDTGIGMSPEVCKRAFESFFTTKEIGKGTGLGLFISYNLVSEIDGNITLESELGKGTTVIIQIPIRAQKDIISDSKGQKNHDSVKSTKESE